MQNVTVGIDDSNLQADSGRKVDDLVWRSAATWGNR